MPKSSFVEPTDYTPMGVYSKSYSSSLGVLGVGHAVLGVLVSWLVRSSSVACLRSTPLLHCDAGISVADALYIDDALLCM
jgi:hypothetical protein